MTLRNRFPRSSGWQIEIIASDLSTKILDRAREAIWPIQKAADIPYEHLKRFMLRGTSSQEGKMKAGAEIRDLVEFRRLNRTQRLRTIRPASSTPSHQST